MPAPQYRYWLLTIPANDWTPTLHDELDYIRGQQEIGDGTGYRHWQLLAHSKRKLTYTKVKSLFPTTTHVEHSRSSAATAYVWKEETSIPDTKFELGQLPFKRNSREDWKKILDASKEGKYDDIPADILVRHYNAIRRITADNLKPVAAERQVVVFWGRTGSGKSMRAWEEATLEAYPKDPNTKFWDGYRGNYLIFFSTCLFYLDHSNVVIDEFRGGIAINHLLRWFDRYPVIVEVKGGATVLRATNIWITSNISPDDWYPELDQETKAIVHLQ